MQVKFGLQNDCPGIISPWLRARFEILWMASAPYTTLFSKVVEIHGDTEASEAAVAVLPGRSGNLKLRAESEGGNCPARVWWSDLDVR